MLSGSMLLRPCLTGILFDIYHLEDILYLWILDQEGHAHLVTDTFYPVIYAHGSKNSIKKLSDRLTTLGVLKDPPFAASKLHFYQNRMIDVTAYRFARPSFLRTIHKKLYALFGRIDIYHSDIEVPTNYMYEKRIFPTARIRVHAGPGPHLEKIELLEDSDDPSYRLPSFRIMKMRMKVSHRISLSAGNSLLIEANGEEVELSASDPARFLSRLNEILDRADPDVILSAYGDQIIMPEIFSLAQKHGVEPHLDRDRVRTLRKIYTKGTSYMTYGSIVFRAPSYPLFGRWHIDSCNSFVFKESRLDGIVELARLSKLPVQRLARSSTGTAMTSIQTQAAFGPGYLVPWQKSHLEEKKTALELLNIDKGGLVFEPDIRESCVFEQVAQLDFSQMYPSIMVNHNISPETVLCDCCRGIETPRVPEANYHICVKRRGVVPTALAPILARRKYYKNIKKQTTGDEQERAEARQSSLKWLLVTSFGYLGYRNAKFGRLESHEAVTAFGRDKLLNAAKIAEDSGCPVLHAITDCLFVRMQSAGADGAGKTDLENLCSRIYYSAGVEIAVEGVFSWIVFLPSRADEKIPVANRYFGRYENGVLKVRGIAARRKDSPTFIQNSQKELLSIMQTASTSFHLRSLHPRMDAAFHSMKKKIERREVVWQDLLLRRTISRNLEDYTASGPSLLSLQQLASGNIRVQPGEKIRYLITSQGHADKSRRYLAEEIALMQKQTNPQYDVKAYTKLLREAYREIWECFAPAGYFAMLEDGQRRLGL